MFRKSTNNVINNGANRPSRHIGAATAYLIWESAFAVLTGMLYLVLSVYYVQQVGLLPLQLVLVGTAVEVSSFIFEIPTGVLADTYSRRLSVLIGTLLNGVWALLCGAFPIFGWIIVAEIIRGLGWTFISGAYQAWITDEVGEERAGKLFLRAGQFSTVGSLIGMALGVVIGSVSLQLALLIGGAGFVLLTLVLVVIMPENSFKPSVVNRRESTINAVQSPLDHSAPDAGTEPEASLTPNPFATFRAGWKHVRGSRMILLLLLAAVITGAFSEGYDRLNNAQWITVVGIPGSMSALVFFALVGAAGTPLYLIGSELVRRYADLQDARQTAWLVFSFQAATLIGVIVFALAQSWQWALIAYIVIGQVRGLAGPVRDAWLNQHLKSETRATAFSMYGQADAFGQIGGGPIVGAIGNLSLRAALAISGLLLAPALWLYARTMRREED